jgi:molybdenum cofactor cytidylyltransferase
LISAIVLAAGASSRFGTQKLVAPVGGTPLVRIVVEQVLASQVDRVSVVLGNDAPSVRAALSGLGLVFVHNSNYAQGMSTSLRRGVSALPPEVQAAAIVLGDQPLPSPAILDGLVRAFGLDDRRPIVVPSYNGQRGNPVLFGRALFPELMQVTGDQGARGVVASRPELVQLVEHPFPVPPDVDTLQEYEALLKRYPSGAP